MKSYKRNFFAGFVLTFLAVPQAIAGADPVTIFEPGFVPPILTPKGSSSQNTANGPKSTVQLKTVSAAGTASITSAISFANSVCFGGASAYLVSCLGSQISDIAATIPRDGDYAESARILKETSAKLQNLARSNRAGNKPTVRYSAQSGERTIKTGPLVAVETDAIPSVNQQAEAILQEAETLLLRATSNSDRRRSHYAAMSQVVGSSKILLRSL